MGACLSDPQSLTCTLYMGGSPDAWMLELRNPDAWN